MPNPINIKELIADREVGTGGSWVWKDDNAGYAYFSAPESKHEWMGFAKVVITVDCQPCKEGEANARRIARLPDLEAAYIEAVGVLRGVKMLMESDRDEDGYKAICRFLGDAE